MADSPRPDEAAVLSDSLALAALRAAGVSDIHKRHPAAIDAVSQAIAAFLLAATPRTPVELAAEALTGLTPEAVREAARLAGINLDGETEAERVLRRQCDAAHPAKQGQ